jgi:hypothetical protein
MNHELTFERPNLLVMRLKGEWKPEDVLYLNDKAMELVGEKREVTFLLDGTELESIPPKTRENLVKYRLPFTYLKMALLTKNNKMKVLGILILKMLPAIKKSKYFEDEAQARAWLGEEKE